MTPYTELLTQSVCTKDLLSLIPTLEFNRVYGDMEAAILDVSILMKDLKIHALITHFGIDIAGKISILRLKPHTGYYWHTDGGRSAAINMLLSGYDSLTLFGYKEGVFIRELTKVPYRENTYFLLDTGVHHSVYNFTETRYLLSIGIPKTFTVNDIKAYIQEMQV